jgi:hypothetical protein
MEIYSGKRVELCLLLLIFHILNLINTFHSIHYIKALNSSDNCVYHFP